MQILALLRPRTSLPTAKAFFVSLPRNLRCRHRRGSAFVSNMQSMHLATWTCHGLAQHAA